MTGKRDNRRDIDRDEKGQHMSIETISGVSVRTQLSALRGLDRPGGTKFIRSMKR